MGPNQKLGQRRGGVIKNKKSKAAGGAPAPHPAKRFMSLALQVLVTNDHCR